MACPGGWATLRSQALPGSVGGAAMDLSHWGGAHGAQKVLNIPSKRPGDRTKTHMPTNTRVSTVPYPSPNTNNYQEMPEGSSLLRKAQEQL